MKLWKLIPVILMLVISFAQSREIGNGQGSAYPYELDADTRPETADDYARETLMNDFSSATVNIENTLGTKPQGNYSNVKTRLDAIQSSTAPSSTNDQQCRYSTGTLLSMAYQLGIDTTTLKNALSFSTNSIVISLRVSTSTLESMHISSMTTLDGLLAELYKSTGSLQLGLRISTETIQLNLRISSSTLAAAIISSGTILDTALREIYISTGAAGLRGANQTWSQPNTALSSWTFLSILSGTSMNLSGGATFYERLNVKQIGSGDIGNTGDVYLKCTSSDSWGKASGGGVSSAKWTMHLYPKSTDIGTLGSPQIKQREYYSAVHSSSRSYFVVSFAPAGSERAFYTRIIDRAYSGGDVYCNIAFMSTGTTAGTIITTMSVTAIGVGDSCSLEGGTIYTFPTITPGAALALSTNTVVMTSPFVPGKLYEIVVSMGGTHAGDINVLDIWFEE